MLDLRERAARPPVLVGDVLVRAAQRRAHQARLLGLQPWQRVVGVLADEPLDQLQDPGRPLADRGAAGDGPGAILDGRLAVARGDALGLQERGHLGLVLGSHRHGEQVAAVLGLGDRRHRATFSAACRQVWRSSGLRRITQFIRSSSVLLATASCTAQRQVLALAGAPARCKTAASTPITSCSPAMM